MNVARSYPGWDEQVCDFCIWRFCAAPLFVALRHRRASSLFAALLGRFLPRLGPFVIERPFFFAVSVVRTHRIAFGGGGSRGVRRAERRRCRPLEEGCPGRGGLQSFAAQHRLGMWRAGLPRVPQPSLGVSSLDLGRSFANGLFSCFLDGYSAARRRSSRPGASAKRRAESCARTRCSATNPAVAASVDSSR